MVQHFCDKVREGWNWYDPCVANKQINGSQCTMCWYVDDTKISHLDHKVVSRVIKSLEDDFGKMTVDRGKSHKFVRMNVELLIENYDERISRRMHRVFRRN